mmetsp:Transcript_3633/g.4240  ORF Transcript_3633/g.4240 Transcript_3633/m.4240 type:complete len:140 (+) Transcript_3633:371-790(+)
MDPNTKLFQASHKEISNHQWLRIQGKKRQLKYINKEINTPKEFFLNFDCSDGIRNFVKKEGRFLTKFRKTIQKCAQNLIKVGNKLFNTYTEFKEKAENDQNFFSYNKKDINIVFDMVNKFKGIKFYKPHYLWDIPKKKE